MPCPYIGFNIFGADGEGESGVVGPALLVAEIGVATRKEVEVVECRETIVA